MYLQIELSEKLIAAINAAEATTLTCKVSVKPKLKRKKKEKVVTTSLIAHNIIEHWNYYSGRKGLEGDRNLQFDQTQLSDIPRIESVIKELGKEELYNLIDIYQEQCSSGGYLKHDRNLAYKTLGSFCTALLKNTNKWWLNIPKTNDGDEELTFWIADCFAVRYLSRKTYGLSNGTKAYQNFYKTQKVLDNIQKVDSVKYNEEESLKVLFKCIDSNYKGNTVHPGTLCSEHTRKVLLPQYLKKVGN